MSALLLDFPSGPLDYYREKATFDWKKLKIFIETEDVVKYQNDLHEILIAHPEFHTNFTSNSFDEERRKSARKSIAHQHIDLLKLEHLLQNTKFSSASIRIMMQLSPASSIKYSVGNQLFTNVIRSLGTERHYHYFDLVDEGKIFGCFCLTEIGHGTNTKGMQTKATFSKEKQQFILHSNNFEAAKCWAGGLGQNATHGVVYAQLYTEEVHHGLHIFVVPLRDPNTLLPYPGIIVGDMGEKIGLNGVDNGFIMFNNYHIPRESLLNKNGDVTPDGKYVTPFKNARDRHGAALGALSVGRVNITGICEAYGTKALTIAIRYAAVRKQFGPENEDEVSILEYQTHQYRLLPYLAAAYVFRISGTYLIETMIQFTVDSFMGNNKESLPALGMELHAISAASKPVAGWIFRDAIQECREACGGHGYLKASGLGDIKNDHDANCTYEGENHVLIQQTANWLLKLWPLIEKEAKITTPLESANFLSQGLRILEKKFKATNLEEIREPKTIIEAYQWLVCYYLRETKNKLAKLQTNQKDEFWAKNNSQVFYAKNLSITFLQHFVLQRMLSVINTSPDGNIRRVLLKLFSLYGLFTLEKFLASLYQGGYAEGPKLATLVQEGILKLCDELKNEAIALVDAIAPPDFILNSVLGCSDGEVYKRLQSVIYRTPNSMSRPEWWQEIVHWKTHIQSKI